jgi:hypothetical protein
MPTVDIISAEDRKGQHRVRVLLSGPWGTVPELLFEKKGLIPALQQMLAERGSEVTSEASLC